MEKQEKILRKLNREITNMYNDGTLETDQFNELTDLTNKALSICEVSRSKCFDKQDLLRAYQAGSIESQEDSVAFGYDDLKELTENSEKWYKRYIK